MPNYVVQDRATGEVVYAYTADEPSHTDVYPYDTYNHIPQVTTNSRRYSAWPGNLSMLKSSSR